MIPKLAPLQSKKLRQASKGKPCIRCDREDGTVCGRHYEGERKYAYGKGRGIKCHDFLLADLCEACDRELSHNIPHKGTTDALAHSEEWLHYVILTLIRRFEEGVIKL